LIGGGVPMVTVVFVDTPAPDQPLVTPEDAEMSLPRPVDGLIETSGGALLERPNA